MKGHRNFDVRMQTLVNWTSQGRSFQAGSLSMVRCDRQINIYLELADPAYRLLNHRFHHFYLSAFQRDSVALCEDAHDCRHTTSECCSHEVGWRKRGSLAAIIERGIGGKFCAGWT